MKLYYAPGACSLSPHIVAREAGLALQLVKVNLQTHLTEDGKDFRQINPKGYVPALELDNGELLTEGSVIAQYLADLAPTKNLAPSAGTAARYRLQEWQVYISTELHKNFGPLWNSKSTSDAKEAALATINKRLAYIEPTLAKQPYLLGDNFTAADAYLFTVANWANFLKLDFSQHPALMAFMARVRARSGVKAALEAEGIG
jgi:glutathione S-transferase